ncbi:MAG TPA: DUF2750 domain-containing protein [Cytophagaceae bacterium]|jgi:hypothetical protein|nr:DUF2750 domain-containing protein [Cytophagaceae bacterium]
MIDEYEEIQQRHKTFITCICETETVWALEKEEGFATSTSLNYEDDDDEPVEVLCFWSDKDLAASCAKDDWQDYSPVAISLGDFIENWCIGMANDLILAGTNFDQDLIGHEIDSLELIVELDGGLKKIGKEIVLENHKSLNDLVAEVSKILNNQDNRS